MGPKKANKGKNQIGKVVRTAIKVKKEIIAKHKNGAYVSGLAL